MDQNQSHIDSLGAVEKRELKDLYNKFDSSVFTGLDGNLFMFASIYEHDITTLLESYVKSGFTFEYKDYTKDVLFNVIDIDSMAVDIPDWELGYFSKMVMNFQKNNLTIDWVLDKINECGEDSLTEIDKLILVG